MNDPLMSRSCPKPNTCLFTGCQGDCRPPLPAAACAGPRATSELLSSEVAWRGQSLSPFKLRDPLAQRRLLVA